MNPETKNYVTPTGKTEVYSVYGKLLATFEDEGQGIIRFTPPGREGAQLCLAFDQGDTVPFRQVNHVA